MVTSVHEPSWWRSPVVRSPEIRQRRSHLRANDQEIGQEVGNHLVLAPRATLSHSVAPLVNLGLSRKWAKIASEMVREQYSYPEPSGAALVAPYGTPVAFWFRPRE